MKKIILAILCLALTAGVSCTPSGEPQPPSDSSATTSPTSATEIKPQTTTEPREDLPEMDFDGYEFHVLALDELVPYTYFETPEESGEVMNDAIYNRNLAIEDRFNMKFKLTALTGSGTHGIYDRVNNSVMAGDHNYDLINPHIIRDVSRMVVSGLLYDWNNVPEVDFTKPWWNKSQKETLEVDGKLFIAAGDMIVPNVRLLLFNKQMIKDLELPDIYSIVREGNWTFDEMMEYMKDVPHDLNGNGVVDIEDRFGVGSLDAALISLIHGSGERVLSFDKDGYPVTTLNTEKMADIFKKIYDLIYTNNNCVQSIGYTNDLLMDTNRVLFVQGVLLKIQGLRASDVEFGMIPLPKYSVAQENYESTVWNGLLALPSDTEDTERTGIIMEALAAESYRQMKPAYYEMLLKGKLVRDDDSSEMLDLIFDNLIYDFGLVFDEWVGNAWAIRDLMTRKSLDIASYWQAHEDVIVNHYDDLFNAIKEYK